MTSGYWYDTLNEILGDNGVQVRGSTLATIAEQVESAASVSVDYAAPTGDRSVEYTFEEITCPQCGGNPDHHISYGTRISSKDGCPTCRGECQIKIVREISQ